MIRLAVLAAIGIALSAPAALAADPKGQADAIKITPAQALKAANVKAGEKVSTVLINLDDTRPCYRIVFANGKTALIDATTGKLVVEKTSLDKTRAGKDSLDKGKNAKMKGGEEEDDDDDDDDDDE